MAIKGIPLFDPRTAYIEDRREPPDTLFDPDDDPGEDPEWWDYHDGDDEVDKNGLHWWERK